MRRVPTGDLCLRRLVNGVTAEARLSGWRLARREICPLETVKRGVAAREEIRG